MDRRREEMKGTGLSSNLPTLKLSTYLPMIPGSCTVSRSSRIQAGIPCPGSSWPERGLDLESASGSVFLEDMGGAGITGDTTGTAEQRSTTTTPTFLTAQPASITTTPTT